MASEWIKLCHDTPLKPEVLELASILQVTRREAFGIAMEFWLWVDKHFKDGRLRRIGVSHVDAALSQFGLTSALVQVGWLAYDDNDELIIPNFDRHNGTTAKERSARKERNNRFRGSMRRERDESETESETQHRLTNVSQSSSPSSSCIESLRSKDEEASEAKPTAPSKAARSEAAFIRFWEAYHINRTGKLAAMKAWKKVPEAIWDRVIAAAKLYSDTKAECVDKYVCHPSTWLNEGRWDDDPESWLSEVKRERLLTQRKFERWAQEDEANERT